VVSVLIVAAILGVVLVVWKKRKKKLSESDDKDKEMGVVIYEE
jgi:uncharacterized membrane-anchored protein